MSDSQQKPWSNNPNAPKILYRTYFQEKVSYAGIFVSSILYGIIIVLFFKCMVALYNPGNCRKTPIRWGLVSYTTAMFLLATVGTVTQLDVQSLSYIDNRQFPGAGGVFVPGPLGYQELIATNAIVVIENLVFVLSDWLADGFLFYRCYAVYSMNLWVITFPCLAFLGSFAMGITFVYQNTQVNGASWSALPYWSISLSLNILLTLMIVVRLILHTRDTRNALGITGIGGLCKAIIIMLVESCALFAVNSLLVIGLLVARNPTCSFFLAIIPEILVIAPLLIILRVANRSALTSNTIASGRIGGFKAWSRGGLTSDSGALPGGDPASSADQWIPNSGELAIGVGTTDIGPRQDRAQEASNFDALHS